MAAESVVPQIVDKKGGAIKRESQWTQDERRVVVQDQRLKSIIMSCLPNDIIESVISCETTKPTWTDLVHSFKGPSNTKKKKIMDLKLEYQTLRAKPSESLSQTYTRYKTLLNELANDGVNLFKHEINTLDLADIYGMFVYEDNLIQRRYSNSKKARITTLSTPISTAFFSNNVIRDFQENSDDELDERIISYDEEMTQVNVLMALADDELTVGKNHARNGEWIDITMRKVNDLLSMDEDADWQNYLKIKTNLFDYETPLYAKFNEFNYLLKVDPKLFTHDIQRTKTYEDYEKKLNNEIDEPWSEDRVPYEMYNHICKPFCFKNGKTKWPTCNSNEDGFCNGGKLPGMVRVSYMTYFQDYEWYDELVDGNLKEEALKQKAIYEKSWGDASQSVIIFCAWLKRSFGNFPELDYELLVKLQDYWWKVNHHECSPFSNWRDHIRGPYANFITTYDPYLDINSIFGMNDNASNMSNVMEEQRNKRCNLFDNTTHDAPVCEIRRFEMIKYSFGQDEEYVAIKECEYDDLTRTNEDACRAYQNIL
ncbi:hypothetical protein Tco_0265653 [Tanacetum coccineum]